MPTALAPARPVPTYTDSHTRACRRVGSNQEAAALDPLVSAMQDYMPADAPEGWEKLGTGAFRVALRSPAGWVYKVPLGLHGVEASQREVCFWRMALRHQEYRALVPHYRLFEVGGWPVVAMESLTVDRTRANFPQDDEDREKIRELREAAYHVGCGDLHGGNVGWRGDHALLLDAGGAADARVTKNSGCAHCNPIYEARRTR